MPDPIVHSSNIQTSNFVLFPMLHLTPGKKLPVNTYKATLLFTFKSPIKTWFCSGTYQSFTMVKQQMQWNHCLPCWPEMSQYFLIQYLFGCIHLLIHCTWIVISLGHRLLLYPEFLQCLKYGLGPLWAHKGEGKYKYYLYIKILPLLQLLLLLLLLSKCQEGNYNVLLKHLE